MSVRRCRIIALRNAATELYENDELTNDIYKTDEEDIDFVCQFVVVV